MRFSTRLSIAAGVALSLAGGAAHAQSSTTGAVRGAVREKGSGEPVAGATVVATSDALQGTQAAITDSDGAYFISNLPPGMYTVTVYHLDAEFSRGNVLVRLGKVSEVNIGINSAAGEGEVIKIKGSAPIIDQQSTKTGTTVTGDYTENVPTGRTFASVLGAAAGSQGDTYGVSFGGSTSVENQYIVEGVNTTDPGFGLLTTNLPNEFIRETEIITGGYKAEYGRATGGIINVITKQGSNEFHGSVFSYWSPGLLTLDADRVAVAGSSIEREDHLASSFDSGAELGGPVIEDKLWFHVGLNPSFSYTDVHRIIRSQVDEDGDGVPDVGADGLPLFGEELARQTFEESRKTVYYTAKLTGAVSPNHQGSLALLGSPGSRESIPTVTGAPSATHLSTTRDILDTSGKWTSKLSDGRSQIDLVLGYHYDQKDQGPGADGGLQNHVVHLPPRPLSDYQMFEAGVPEACVDGTPDDPYPMITNCPVPEYRSGGIGFLEDTTSRRLVADGSFTQRLKAAGHHTFKLGANVEEQRYAAEHLYTGGTYYVQHSALYDPMSRQSLWLQQRFYTVADCDPASDPGCVPCGSDIDGDGVGDATCDAAGRLSADTRTRNLAAFVQDDWAVLPNLVFNLGVRWEQQQLFAADQIAGEISPLTGEPISGSAFTLSNMIAPRVGVIFDPTKEGRSRLYGHWGRYYESIPMDINVRSYGGEIIDVDQFLPGSCNATPGMTVGSCTNAGLADRDLIGSGEQMVAPGLGAQYLDEIVVGGDLELLPDLKIGAAYIRRDLGRVIEDVSTDGANTYVIANPGEIDRGAIQGLRDQAADLRAGVDCSGMSPPPECGRADFLDLQADQYEGAALFDRPRRTYNALQVTADKRFSNNIFLQASYTYSRLVGNYPGLFSPETGQLDPNTTSMYDLPELMANRYGPLPADRPHLFKLDAYYTMLAGDSGLLTLGARARAGSGVPHNVLGSHVVYGTDESYILERGSAGRSPLLTRFDAKVAYGLRFNGGMMLQAFVDVFNLFNQQTEVDADESYTFDNVNPIVGGDQDDLEHAKALGSDGLPTGATVTKRANFGNTVSRQPPLSMRLGMRLVF